MILHPGILALIIGAAVVLLMVMGLLKMLY